MKFRSDQQSNLEDRKLLATEAAEHDNIYNRAYPFWSNSTTIDIDRVWGIFDDCYKEGTHVHGERKRRMLELVDVGSIEGKTVLDVGCGNGQYSVFLAMHGAHVHGFDISREGVRMARSVADANGVADQCSFSVQSATNIAYPAESFDVVLASATLHHIWKYNGVQDELYRVLNPGGRFVFDEGLRGNPLYRVLRDTYDRLQSGTPELGDVDLEYDDLVRFGDRFSSTHIECATLLSGWKTLSNDPVNRPAHVRRLLRLCKAIDSRITNVAPLRPYCLDIVGKFVK